MGIHDVGVVRCEYYISVSSGDISDGEKRDVWVTTAGVRRRGWWQALTWTVPE